jgi:hypothetical protein
MTKLIVGNDVSDQLDALNSPVDLCDQSGRVLGQFIPAFGITAEQAAADGCPYSIEELRQSQRQTGGRSLAEIWRDLGRT